MLSIGIIWSASSWNPDIRRLKKIKLSKRYTILIGWKKLIIMPLWNILRRSWKDFRAGRKQVKRHQKKIPKKKQKKALRKLQRRAPKRKRKISQSLRNKSHFRNNLNKSLQNRAHLNNMQRSQRKKQKLNPLKLKLYNSKVTPNLNLNNSNNYSWNMRDWQLMI